MFYELICYAVFWTVIGELSYFLSKFTTIGTREDFGEFIFKVENFVKFRLKMESVAAWILSLSYGKAFICRPCHTFWMCTAFHWVILPYYWAIFAGLLAYGMAKNIENHAQKQVEKRANRNKLLKGSGNSKASKVS